MLARLEARRRPVTGRCTAADESTLRRAVGRVDPDAAGAAAGGWLAGQARAGGVNSEALAVAVDGKACAARSELTAGRRAPSPRGPHQGVVVAQRGVGHKTGEITPAPTTAGKLGSAGGGRDR
ncbi:MAG: hypothetical protein ACRDZ4_23510 [Egibacteraceae bacterium]